MDLDRLPATGLVQLIYVSRSAIAPVDTVDAIGQILIKSISNNRLVDVTGQLIIRRQTFMQLLEGPAASVRSTFERVASDTRHSNIRLLVAAAATRRRFRDWNMSERRLGGDGPELEDIDSHAAMSLFEARVL